MSIINCKMSYEDIMCLINSGFKPMSDLKCALDHNYLLRKRKDILMYIDLDIKIIDIMGYYTCNPFPRIYVNPFSLIHDIVTVDDIPEIKEILDNGGCVMFEMNDAYIKEVNANYWAEEEEMKAGVHPSQIIERVRKVLDDSGIKGDITFMDYDGFQGTRVGVSVGGEFYGVFDYVENGFEGTPETRLVEYLELSEMGLKVDNS